MNDLSVSPQQTAPALTGKTFGPRAWAYVIDSVVYFLVTLTISVLMGVVLSILLMLSGRTYHPLTNDPSTQCLDLVVGLVQFALYFAIFEWLYGATLGKLILSMRVTMENGEPCSFSAAFIRSFFRYIDGLFFGVPAYASMKAPLYQRLGDKSAKTVVVDSKSTIIQGPRAGWWFLVALALYVGLTVMILSVFSILPYFLSH